MQHLPIFLNVRGKRTLIVGSGVAAARKADLLLRAGSDVTIVTPQLGDELSRLAGSFEFTHQPAALTAEDLDGCVIAFGCSEDDSLNQHLRRLAASKGIMVNVTDKTEDCDFIMPALVDRTPLLIAISSGGTSPLLVRMLKARFETTIPAAYGRLAEFAGAYRDRIKKLIPNMTRRRRFWESMVSGPVAEHLFSAQLEEAESLMEAQLEEASAAGATP